MNARLGALVETACLLEAGARKPGNVHPGASFADMTYDDFVQSARCIAPVFERARSLSLGQLVLGAVTATQSQLGKNTNLGIILAIAPLAKARDAEQGSVVAVLASLTSEDAHLVYEAIRLACPGGLGSVGRADVTQAPTISLVEAMCLAADRDLIARQYAKGFSDIFGLLLPALDRGMTARIPLEQSIIHTHMESLATLGDTLILRKCGPLVATEVRRRARDVLDRGWPDTVDGIIALREFDHWLRADGHRRNPGTTADLVAAALFLALRQGSIEIPVTRPWDCPAL